MTDRAHLARFLQARELIMKLTRLFVRAAAGLLPLSLVLICVVTPILLPAQDVPAKQSATAGEVRITDGAEPVPELAVTPADDAVATSETLVESAFDADASEMDFDEDSGEVTVSDLWSEHSHHFLSRNREQSEAVANWLYESLGLYTPAAVHTEPFGSYRMVYPVNPRYNDPRDAKVYGAQGAGIPIVVPLAPVVRSGYNYGSGLPASRLTPISVPR